MTQNGKLVSAREFKAWETLVLCMAYLSWPSEELRRSGSRVELGLMDNSRRVSISSIFWKTTTNVNIRG